MALVAFPATASAQAEPTIVQKVDLTVVLDGCQEPVLLTGQQTTGMHISEDNNGGLHIKFSIETRGLKGVGLISGKKYVGADTTENHEALLTKTQNATFVSSHSLVRQGEDALAGLPDDLYLKSLFHFTLPAGGGVPVPHNELRFECK